MMNAEEKSNICNRLSCFNAPHSTATLRIFHSSSGSHRNSYVSKINCTKVLNTFYQKLQSTSVTFHKAIYHYKIALFAYFLTWKRDWLLPNIFAYFHLPMQRIASSSILTGFRKLAFSSPFLTFGSECVKDMLEIFHFAWMYAFYIRCFSFACFSSVLYF